jgi:hypothetical protein
LILLEEHRLKVLRVIFGSRREEVTGDRTQVSVSDGLCCCQTATVRVIQQDKVSDGRGKQRNACSFRERDQLEDLGIGREVILNLVLKK